VTSVIDGADVVVCCGSGGVGKTTVAAAIGLAAARAGRRVVVVTIDPARRLADALGLPGGLTGDPQRIELADAPGELWAMMLDTPAMFERVVRMNATSDEQVARIVQNRFYRNMADALSGTQEFMASEALYELHADQRFDLVVVDTPPSRNALDFLEAPGVLARFLDHKVFRLIMLPTRTGFRMLSFASQPILRAIGRVVGSDALADAAAFFQAFAGMEGGFRERAEMVASLLQADTTRFVLVTSPQRETVDEAAWFADQLIDLGFGVAAVVANRVHPQFGGISVAEARRRAARAERDSRHDQAALWGNLADLRHLAEAERTALAPLLARAPDGSTIEIPLLPTDVHDLEALDHVAEHLAIA
jgi:anion-transporting  ArsA/GET3 family ATPase